MSEMWNQLRQSFEHDDGSLPEIDLRNLDPAAIQGVFGALWSRGRDVTAGGGSYHDRRDKQTKSIGSAEEAASLVCSGEADSIHVVLEGLECAGSPIPDLGVLVHPDSVTLDYRMGPAWGPQQLTALLGLLCEIAETAPAVVVHHESSSAFANAWQRYREARSTI